MRVLGIETSTRRGSVAALLDGALIGSMAHEEPSAHAERALMLIDVLLAELGWARSSLDRIAVGIGPGSFTGLRVGIALAQGIALGLERPLVGIGSLRALATKVPASDQRVRVPVLDARRGEVFIAAYGADGGEQLPPVAVPPAEVAATLRAALGGSSFVLVGEAAALVGPGFDVLTGDDFDLPHASATALLGALVDPASAPTEPIYVRDAGATPQNIPRSPLA